MTIAEPHLTAEFLRTHPRDEKLPERVLQFGEGNFLRGFVDWMIHGMNQQGIFNGRVVVVQPIAQGQAEMINRQDGAYTLLMRGIEDGVVVERQELIRSISRAIDPYTQFQKYLCCAHNPELRFIVSNTTEAGICFNRQDKLTDQPPSSFPGKLTRLLLERYNMFCGDQSKGFILLPCELIDRNGDMLKQAVLDTAANWKLEPAFVEWITSANTFTNTLVDRIVTGYPRNEIESLWRRAGYTDDLFATSEIFHLWVIEGPPSLSEELPFAKAGFNVIIADSMKPYRDRKVGILNGAHTSTVLAAYLAGFDFVGDFMADPEISGFMKQAIFEEVIPTLTLPQDELVRFAEAVFERFGNPFIQHALLAVSLNSVSKYKARLLPSVERYIALKGKLPRRLTFSMAALIAFYRGTVVKDGVLRGNRDGREYPIKDNLEVLETMATLWSSFDGSRAGVERITEEVLQQTDWWGQDLTQIPGFAAAVAEFTAGIFTDGVRATLATI